MAKAPIKLEGFIGSTKVCNDLILGSVPKNASFSDQYSRMIFVGIDGVKNPSEQNQLDDDFGELICPITDFTLEQQMIDKQYS